MSEEADDAAGGQALPGSAKACLDLSLYLLSLDETALAANLRARAVAQAGEEACATHVAARAGLEEGALEALLGPQCAEVLAIAIETAAAARNAGGHAGALVLSSLATRLVPGDVWRWLDHAGDLLALDRGGEAEAAYRHVLELDGINMPALLGVIRAARARGDHAAALQAAEAAAAWSPRDVWRWLDVAAELMALGRAQKAEAAYRRVLELDEANMAALLGVIRAARARGNHAAALQAAEAAAAAAPGDVWRRLDVAAELQALGRAQKAEAAYRRVLELEPANMAALLGVIRAARARGNHAAALQGAEAAAALAPRDVWRWLDVAAELQALGRAGEAEAAYRRVLELETANMVALLGVIGAARARDDHAAALRAAEEAAELAPRDVWRWLDVAEELGALGRAAEAEAAYRRVLALEPGSMVALLGIIRAARARGDHAAALRAAEAAAELAPGDVWRWLDVAEELGALGQNEAEAVALARVLALEPGHKHGQVRAAHCARKRGALEEAVAGFTRAAQLTPGDMWRWVDVGETLSALGRLEEAEAAFRQAVAAAPGDVQAVQRLAGCIRARGGKTAEEAFYRDYAAAHPAALWARLRVAAGLREDGRLEEAEALCREVLAQEPENAQALLGLGLCARARHDHAAALPLFQEAVRLAPDELWLRQEWLQELRATGAVAAALAQAELMQRLHPGEVQAWLALAQCLRDAGRHEEAMAAYMEAAGTFPAHNGVLVELAAQARRLGQHEAAAAHLARVLERDPVNVAAIADLGRTALLLGEPGEAFHLFNDALEQRPDEPVFQMGVIDCLAASGEIDEAVRRLEGLEAAQGPLAALRAKRMALLRQTGRLHEAVWLARGTTSLYPDNFWLWFERFFCELQAGPGSMVDMCLDAMPAASAHEFGMRQRCRGLAAESRLMFGTALRYYADAVRLLPEDTAPLNDLTRAGFITMELETSFAHLRAAGLLEVHNNKLRGRPLNVSQTHYGQILDEYRMDQEATAAAAVQWARPPRARLAPLRALVAAAPDNTALAVSLLFALRQCDGLRGAPLPGGAIPRVIHQFWDSEAVPQDIEKLMRSWRETNPGWEVRLYNDRTAETLLAANFPPQVLAAFRRSREPAQRADLFRLAVLVLTGGVYADSDDRCLRPLDDFLPAGAGLVFYQEDLGTLGNNFMAVAPRALVMLRALEQAVNAINRGDTDIVWLATGPALISRVVAAWLARMDAPPPGLFVFDRREAFQAIGMHCAAGYKRSGRHWLETSFAKRQTSERRTG